MNSENMKKLDGIIEISLSEIFVKFNQIVDHTHD